MCTRSMSKRLNVDALPGVSVGFVGDEVIAVRSDLYDYQGWQVRAPRAVTCVGGAVHASGVGEAAVTEEVVGVVMAGAGDLDE